MTEHNEEISKEVPEVGNEPTEIQASEPEYSDIEKEAMEKGWKPKTAFSGEHFVSAEEFIRAGSLFKRIEEQNKKLRKMEELLAAQTTHLTQTQEEAYKRAKEQLEAQRDKAVELGDVQSFRKLDNQYKEIEKRQSEDPLVNTPKETTVDNDVVEFANKHSFFKGVTDEDKEMIDVAKALDQILVAKAAREGRKVDVKAHLKAIEDKLKLEYRHRFTNDNRAAPASVGKSTSSSSTTKDSSIQLTPQQKMLAEYFEKNSKGPNAYTKEKYIADLKKSGRLGK